MQRVEVLKRFDAPPERVFAVYCDHAGWSRWAGIQRSWLEREGDTERDGAGAVRGLATGGIAAFEEVLEYEFPKRMTYRVIRGGLPMRDHLGEVLFERDGEGTRVLWRCQFESRVPGLGPVMRWFVTRVFRRALQGLESFAFPPRIG